MMGIVGLARAETDLAAGELVCLGCGATLRPWGHVRTRRVRDRASTTLALRPRRTRCAACGAIHMLLLGAVLPRRLGVVVGVLASLHAPGSTATPKWAVLASRRHRGLVAAATTATWVVITGAVFLLGPAGPIILAALLLTGLPAIWLWRRFAAAANHHWSAAYARFWNPAGRRVRPTPSTPMTRRGSRGRSARQAGAGRARTGRAAEIST